MWKYSFSAWISGRVKAGSDDARGENQEAVGGEDLLSISVSQGAAEQFPCVCVLIFGQLRAGVLDFSLGSLFYTLILLSGGSYVVHSLWPAGIEMTVLI